MIRTRGSKPLCRRLPKQGIRRTPRRAHRRLSEAVSPGDRWIRVSTAAANFRPMGVSAISRGQRSLARGALLPVRALPADRVEPARRAAGESAGDLERRNDPAWDEVHGQHQHRDELLAVGVANLAECQVPLFDVLEDLAAPGAKTAKEQYSARGWVLHHNTDLWRGTAPIDASNHGIWPTGGAWLSTHLWEHYLFTGDKQFLATPLTR